MTATAAMAGAAATPAPAPAPTHAPRMHGRAVTPMPSVTGRALLAN